MKEIGGYIEINSFKGGLYHNQALRLNCGRNCLEYLIEANDIKKIWLPRLICDSLVQRCEKNNVEIGWYSVDETLKSHIPDINDQDWLFLVNYYGQLQKEEINDIKRNHKNIICDNTQAFFVKPDLDINTLYSCRKYFGVSDGAYLYTQRHLKRNLKIDYSYDRIGFLLGRYEKDASEFYNEYVMNNDRFIEEPIKQMSKLTENILRSIDYEYVKEIRTKNWNTLNERLKKYNNLMLLETKGAFSYPLLLNNGKELRKKLIENKIYVPTLWPNVIENQENKIEKYLALNILPLPCDQRYNEEDMNYIADVIQKFK